MDTKNPQNKNPQGSSRPGASQGNTSGQQGSSKGSTQGNTSGQQGSSARGSTQSSGRQDATHGFSKESTQFGSTQGTNNQQNISQTKKIFEEAFNKANFNLLDELVVNNVRLHDAANHHREGLKAFKDTEATYHRAFPNKKTKIDDIISADDKVIVRWTAQGVHKGELEGIAPTNKEVKISGISIYRFANGKVTEIWQSWDRLGLLEQIGEIQPAHALH